MKKANGSILVICGGEKKFWKSRSKAMAFFLEGIRECEGSEQMRYATIYSQLADGCMVCTDER